MILAWASVLLQQEPTREAQVLEVLSSVELGWHYPLAHFPAAEAPFGTGQVFRPITSSMCGNSDEGTFDDDRARQLGLKLFRIYGMNVHRNEHRGDGDKVSLLLDGLDPWAKVGFKLRGRGNYGMFSEALPEHEEAALDEHEFAWLTSEGYRVHVADVGTFRVDDGDEFTPTLAYLVGLIDFLDAVTEGEDVNVHGFLFEREATFPWPAASAIAMPEGIQTLDVGGHRLGFLVEQAGKLAFPCRGLADLGPPALVSIFDVGEDAAKEREPRRLKGSTRGAPTVLVVRGGEQPLESDPKGPDPTFRMRVRQEELVRESASFLLLLPSEFDLAQPFVLEFELSPGRYTFYNRPRIGAAAR